MSVEKPFAPATRIFGVAARAAPVVVLFRRGPSKQVFTIKWNTLKHEFHGGQWFKGRIYEERCDLSPSGDKLIYLAGNHKLPYYAWTAVSRPPYLTALLLWPNIGTWGGGGLFDGERNILLNCGGSLKPADEFRVPKGIHIRPIASWAGRGEDDPIRSMRMKRDGWSLEDAGEQGGYSRYKAGARFAWDFARPERWRRGHGSWILERRLLGIGEKEGPWHVYEHRLLNEHGELAVDFGRSDWADWSLSNELLLARDGRVYRMPFNSKREPRGLEELMDLRGLRFEAVPPPPEAKTWHQRVDGRRIK